MSNMREFLKSKGVEVVHQVNLTEISKYMEIGKEPCTTGIYRTLFAKTEELIDKLESKDWVKLGEYTQVA